MFPASAPRAGPLKAFFALRPGAGRKDRVGGIMFWAANEAAVSSLNGKTTGENSGTLAAYAADLVA